MFAADALSRLWAPQPAEFPLSIGEEAKDPVPGFSTRPFGVPGEENKWAPKRKLKRRQAVSCQRLGASFQLEMVKLKKVLGKAPARYGASQGIIPEQPKGSGPLSEGFAMGGERPSIPSNGEDYNGPREVPSGWQLG